MRVNKIIRRKAVLLAAGITALASLTGTALAEGPDAEFTPGSDPRVTVVAADAPPEEVRDFWKGENLLPEKQGKGIDDKTPRPPGEILTKDGDELGYAPVEKPYMNSKTRAIGKIVYQMDEKDGDGKRMLNLCSASAIGGNYVVTASHCVITSKDNYNNKLAFIPDYQSDGKYTPFGVWPAEKSYITTKYREDSDEDFGGASPYDMAIIKVAPDVQGASLEDTLGTKLEYTQTRTYVPEKVAAFGYPGQGGGKYDDGPEMFTCVSELEDDGAEPISQLDAKNCAIQGGNSGGPVLDKNWRVVAVTQSAITEDDEDGKKTSYGRWARLHPDTFGSLMTEAEKDTEAGK